VRRLKVEMTQMVQEDKKLRKENQELRDQVRDLSEKLDITMHIGTTVANCGTRDLDEIIRMERIHPGTVGKAREVCCEGLRDEKGLEFWHFVDAVKTTTMGEVSDRLTEADVNSFNDMSIDANYAAWGSIASYGEYAGSDKEENRERQELFCAYVTGSINRDEFLKRYRKAKRKRNSHPHIEPTPPETYPPISTPDTADLQRVTDFTQKYACH